jgi:outer membrane protein OmpA-like peptidoglycan-associated protein
MISCRIGLVVFASLLSLKAFAENGKLNLSIEPIIPIDLSSDQGTTIGGGLGFHFDWAFSRWVALQTRYQGSFFTLTDPTTEQEIKKLNSTWTVGLRVYPTFLNDQGGYKAHAGNKRGHEGNLLGNFWLDLGAGVSFTGLALSEKELTPKLDMGVGYHLSLIDGVLLGPFARAQVALPLIDVSAGIAADNATIAIVGLSLTLALPARGVHERDSDKDGIIDAEERTRSTNPTDADSDNDGINDGAEVFGQNPTNPLIKDSDGDTLLDGHEDLNANGTLDAGETNPNQADTDAGGLTDSNEELDLSNPLDNRDDDRDRDGVQDILDACEQTPKRLAVNEKGCAIFDRDLVLEGSLFTKNKGVLLSSSYAALQRLAVVLTDNPTLKVEIGAHDPTASGAKGKSLTQARADAIREYLISQGVPAEQMTAKGYGSSAPTVDKKVKGGRVELRRFGEGGALQTPYPTKK